MEALLTPEEAGAVLRMHPRTVQRMLRDGQLPGVKIGTRHWRIPKKALEDYIEAGLRQQKPAKAHKAKPWGKVAVRKRKR